MKISFKGVSFYLKQTSTTLENNINAYEIPNGKIITENIKRIKQIGTYRGMRHSAKLPARGQRTRHNARTRRGKRMTVGALKKEDAQKIADTKKE